MAASGPDQFRQRQGDHTGSSGYLRFSSAAGLAASAAIRKVALRFSMVKSTSRVGQITLGLHTSRSSALVVGAGGGIVAQLVSGRVRDPCWKGLRSHPHNMHPNLRFTFRLKALYGREIRKASAERLAKWRGNFAKGWRGGRAGISPKCTSEKPPPAFQGISPHQGNTVKSAPTPKYRTLVPLAMAGMRPIASNKGKPPACHWDAHLVNLYAGVSGLDPPRVKNPGAG